jgi:hypothetical protein
MAQDIIIGLITGLVSGVLSGYLVYFITKRREQKYQVCLYWETFLYKALGECEMYIPSEAIYYASEVDKSGSAWFKAILGILDLQNPYPEENRELNEREAKMFENVSIALEELEKWKKKNHLK